MFVDEAAEQNGCSFRIRCVASAEPKYDPRDPSTSVLVQLLQEHLSAFDDAVESGSERALPAFVRNALEAVRDCGDFLAGFIRLRCGSCETDRILPFSCKVSVCASCAGRRMSDTAAWLVDRVLLPKARWRQYVLTFPPELAVGLCFRSELAGAVTRLCMRVLSEFQRGRADSDAAGVAHSAGVVWIQRFSDGAGCWLHLHVLAPDGVFRELPYSLAAPFEPQPPPTPSEAAELVRRIATRVHRLLRRRATVAPDDPLLERCARQPATPIRKPTPAPSRTRRPNPLRTEHHGFTLHASTSAPPHDTEALERLCRYVARPAIPAKRVRLLPDGRVVFTLKRPRRGVSSYVFHPIAFLARVAALIPPPFFNTVRYFGALSSASPLRRFIVPRPPQPSPNRPTAPPRPKHMRHCDLIQRVFLADVTTCPCGGSFQQIAVILDPDVAQAVAAAIILSAAGDAAAARGPPAPGRARL